MKTRFLSELATKIEPYVPGEQPKDKKYIKLNTNENPYPPSEAVIKAVQAATGDDLRLYPDPISSEAGTAIAEYYNIKLKLDGKKRITVENVFMGNGSDEILSLLMPAFFKNRTIAFPDITYSFYPVIAGLFQAECRKIPLTEDFSVDAADYTSSKLSGTDGILICNPNAPSGKALPLAEVDKIIRDNQDRLVIVDEAYVDFGAETTVGLVNLYDNLIVVQTLSKSRQLAGLRIGCAIACRELITALISVKDSFNSYPVDRLASAACAAAFRDVEYFEKTRAAIMATRERSTEQMKQLGFEVVPSSANFVFVKPPVVRAAHAEGETDAAYLFKMLRERGILVRYFALPRINNMLRITIGTDDEMKALISALSELVKA